LNGSTTDKKNPATASKAAKREIMCMTIAKFRYRAHHVVSRMTTISFSSKSHQTGFYMGTMSTTARRSPIRDMRRISEGKTKNANGSTHHEVNAPAVTSEDSNTPGVTPVTSEVSNTPAATSEDSNPPAVTPGTSENFTPENQFDLPPNVLCTSDTSGPATVTSPENRFFVPTEKPRTVYSRQAKPKVENPLTEEEFNATEAGTHTPLHPPAHTTHTRTHTNTQDQMNLVKTKLVKK